MTDYSDDRWRPSWVVKPGDILLEVLQDQNMSQIELANRMGRPPKTINEIIKGKAAITAETAIQFEQTLGISARVWTNLESAFREGLARQRFQRQLVTSEGWIDGFPLRQLSDYGLIQKRKSREETAEELLKFFRVSSPDAFDRYWLDLRAAFRRSQKHEISPKLIASWVRWGEIEAAKSPSVHDYDAQVFQGALARIRQMTNEDPFAESFEEAVSECSKAGVIVVVIPEFRGAGLSGATYWMNGKPVMQLSLLFKTVDQFWFSFFHEAGHIVRSRRRDKKIESIEFVEDPTLSDEEKSADNFAKDLLIAPDDYRWFVEERDFTESAIRRFARSQRVASGIVLGRLQRDGYVPWSKMNYLKKKISWSS